ncbi:MAG: hypothetical protein M5U12_14940 [Verrucomicrobia bacterium]|nr:hypothetical protein [Verrucomicrobiota bacterium]
MGSLGEVGQGEEGGEVAIGVEIAALAIESPTELLPVGEAGLEFGPGGEDTVTFAHTFGVEGDGGQVTEGMGRAVVAEAGELVRGDGEGFAAFAFVERVSGAGAEGWVLFPLAGQPRPDACLEGGIKMRIGPGEGFEGFAAVGEEELATREAGLDEEGCPALVEAFGDEVGEVAGNLGTRRASGTVGWSCGGEGIGADQPGLFRGRFGGGGRGTDRRDAGLGGYSLRFEAEHAAAGDPVEAGAIDSDAAACGAVPFVARPGGVGEAAVGVALAVEQGELVGVEVEGAEGALVDDEGGAIGHDEVLGFVGGAPEGVPGRLGTVGVEEGFEREGTGREVRVRVLVWGWWIGGVQAGRPHHNSRVNCGSLHPNGRRECGGLRHGGGVEVEQAEGDEGSDTAVPIAVGATVKDEETAVGSEGGRGPDPLASGGPKDGGGSRT